MKWKSNSNYKVDESKGTMFYLKELKINICIHKIHGCGDSFYLSCGNLDISDKNLNTEDFLEAVNNSKCVIKTEIDKLVKECNKFIDDKSGIEFTRY